jgi:hypothetical protein
LGVDGETYDGDYSEWFGTERTIRDYEKYAGLLFSKRAIQQETLDKSYPPNTYNFKTEEEWEDSFLRIYKHCIDLNLSQVPEDDYDFWVVAFHNSKDETLHRQDATESEIKGYKQSQSPFANIWRTFNTPENPTYWVVWPHSKSKGWGERIVGNL